MQLITLARSIADVLVGARMVSYKDYLYGTVQRLDGAIEQQRSSTPLSDLVAADGRLSHPIPAQKWTGTVSQSHPIPAHESTQEHGECNLLLYKQEAANGSVDWLLHIEKRIAFSFETDAKVQSAGGKSLEELGDITNGSFTLPVKDLFHDSATRARYMEAYAKWGQLAWNGLSMASAGAVRLTVLVWPRVWSDQDDLVRWEDPQAGEMFGEVEPSSAQVSVRLNGTWSIGNIGNWHGLDFLFHGTIWGATVQDVLDLNEEQVFTLTAPDSKSTGANAAHEFGHMITAPHSLRGSELMSAERGDHGKNRMDTRGSLLSLTGPLKWAFDTTGGPGGSLDFLRSTLEIP